MSYLELTPSERHAMNSSAWFLSLSSALRHDLLRCARVERYASSVVVHDSRSAPSDLLVCLAGAVRMNSVPLSGQDITLCCIPPGSWFGGCVVSAADRNGRYAYAQGDTTLLRVATADLQTLLRTQMELRGALLRLHAGHIQRLYELVDELKSLPLRSRLAKHLLKFSDEGRRRSDGVTPAAQEVRVDLQVSQGGLAQVLGVSRQRVNMELKAMERGQAIRLEPCRVFVRNREALMRIAQMR